MKISNVSSTNRISLTTEGSSLLIILPIFGALFLVILIFGICYLLLWCNTAKITEGDIGSCGDHVEQKENVVNKMTIKNASSFDPVSPSVGGAVRPTSAGGARSQVLASKLTITPERGGSGKIASTFFKGSIGPPSLLDSRFGNLDSKLYLDVTIDEPTDSDLDVAFFNCGQAAKPAPKTWGMKFTLQRKSTVAACSPKLPETTIPAGSSFLVAVVKERSPSLGKASVMKNRPNNRQCGSTPLNATSGVKKSAALGPKSRSASNSSRRGSSIGNQKAKKDPGSAAVVHDDSASYKN